MMRYKGVWGLGFVVAAVLRMAFAAIVFHSAGHSTATAASAPTDATTTIASAPQHFGQTPNNIRTSPGREVMRSDGSTREFGDNPAEPIRDSFEDRFGSHGPKRLPTPVFRPGKPMMEPTPSR